LRTSFTKENLTLIDICPEGASSVPLRGGGKGGGVRFGTSKGDRFGGIIASGSTCMSMYRVDGTKEADGAQSAEESPIITR
jgi:hypothetical protein